MQIKPKIYNCFESTFFLGKTPIKILTCLTLLTSLNLFIASENSIAASAKCTPIPVVGGEGNQVNKTVTVPKIPISIGNFFNNNWNTDFAIPSNATYHHYVSNFTANDAGTYSIRMYLKYSDGTADEVYNQKPDLSKGQVLTIKGSPRVGSQPYQVNVFVGDLDSVGKNYTLSVAGCH